MAEGLGPCPHNWSDPREPWGRRPGPCGLQTCCNDGAEGDSCNLYRAESAGALYPDWMGEAGEVQEENNPLPPLALCTWSGAHSLEGHLGVKRRLSPPTCLPDSAGNVPVCLGPVLLTCSLGLLSQRHQASFSPPPPGLLECRGENSPG